MIPTKYELKVSNLQLRSVCSVKKKKCQRLFIKLPYFNKRRIFLFIMSFILLSSFVFSNSRVPTKRDNSVEPYNLYKHVLKRQNISRSSITCNFSNHQHSKSNFPRSFSEKYVLFYNFYTFENLKKENEVNIFDLDYNGIITSKDPSYMVRFLKNLKFCTVRKIQRNFDSISLFGNLTPVNRSVSMKNMGSSFNRNFRNGGYYKPPMCFQEYLYYHSTDEDLYKLKKILDKFRIRSDENMTSLIKKLSNFTYGIVKEHFNSKSKLSQIDLSIVVIPFLRREKNLMDLMANLHPFLQRQFLHYKILIVEQSNFDDSFNKGRLYNSAFDHLLRNYRVQDLNDEFAAKKMFKNFLNVKCMIFHDVDLIPESDYNIYGCGDDYSNDINRNMPRHLSLSIHKVSENLNNTQKKFYYKPNLYELLVGGVLSLKPKTYQKINGFSNEYWNWGAEDDDLGIRMIVNDVCVRRPDSNYALFKMSYHGKSKRNPVRENLLFSTTKRMKKDGLSNFYRLNIKTSEEKKYPLFTILKVQCQQII
ncbi:Beta-1-4-N-acetylgalactosaminyltransferase bre-4 [Brachionus plicatilis]|uniref:Beta-1-4-N-acetylgalactosaminyltransferase bre-4 n=1 Tax=Brachionus plicatilis TaxID=10195 RepID=A0A3M7P4K1_BRAPC|nr:Beta-1-4-N-acetylgalactosaminyltransferase bre-4 [Brachionus plicatilis]